LAGCATVSNPLNSIRTDYKDVPGDDLKAVAQEIEVAVQQGNREPGIADRNGVVVSDPQIVQAIRNRSARAELVDQFRATGFAVEQRNGLLKIRNGSEYKNATTSRERDKNAMIVLHENENRWAIYEGILNKSQFRPGELKTIQQAFYEARVTVLPAGEKYENEAGTDQAK
jgi:hypothetical protein